MNTWFVEDYLGQHGREWEINPGPTDGGGDVGDGVSLSPHTLLRK